VDIIIFTSIVPCLGKSIGALPLAVGFLYAVKPKNRSGLFFRKGVLKIIHVGFELIFTPEGWE
jgi:hypothetical protein